MNHIDRFKQALDAYCKQNKMEVMKPRLALFDMDGVLYNSMPHHAQAWVRCMEQYGIKMTHEEAYLYEGMRGVETIKMLYAREKGIALSEEDAREVYRTKSEEYNKFPVAKQIEGVHQLMNTMKAKEWNIGVVTGSAQPSLIDRLLTDFSGLISPHVIVTANDVTQGKPKPAPYLKGMLKANMTPTSTLVIENAPLGVKAGVAAGAFTIAVNTGVLPNEVLSQEGAHIVLGSMKEVEECISKVL